MSKNLKRNYIYDFDLSYNQKALFEEVKNTKTSPYVEDNPNKDSWFCAPSTWFMGEIKNLDTPEMKSIINQLNKLTNAKDIRPVFVFQEKGTSVPSHLDVRKGYGEVHNEDINKCSVNIQLKEKVGPVSFGWVDADDLTVKSLYVDEDGNSRYEHDGPIHTYYCALLNTQKMHGVPAFDEDRVFIKFNIYDISYEDALNNYLKNKNNES